MPEGPEVRIIATSLNQSTTGKSIVSIEIGSKCKPISNLDKLVVPATVHGVTCHGKKIIWVLDSCYFTSTLGLTGRWSWTPDNNTHLTLIFDRDEKLYFIDAMKYGNLSVLTTKQELNKGLKDIGPDILANAIDLYHGSQWCNSKYIITQQTYRNKARKCNKKQLCAFLMEQKHFSGIGNYLKAEILYRCKFRPDRLISSLTDDEIELLRTISYETIYEAYTCNGLTIRDYWDPNGNTGNFPLQVYNQRTDPHGNKVETGKFADKRTTYWCPEIQK